jgi:hypothetical protein
MNPKYIPITLRKRERVKQKRALEKSQKNYTKGKYYLRPKIAGFKSKPSKYVETAMKKFGVDRIGATKELSKKTGCRRNTLRKIIRKGEGAYYSSGSRPNQTPQSWGIARLASALICGPASKVDHKELKECTKI